MSDGRLIDINVRKMEEFDVAYIRHHGAYDPSDSDLFQALFSKLLAWAVPRGKFSPDKSKVITLFSGGHPYITDQSNLTVDACTSVDPDAEVSGTIGKRKISDGQYAIVQLFGATSEECRQTWDLVFDRWIHQSGYCLGPGDFYCPHDNDTEQHPERLYDVKMFFSVVPQGI
ncbi:Bacterial transcription activator, effector binding domain [Octadecabacter temperatus]|uniref:Bacterial transcription activator, effector binding domain n=1 Tax=Octadecabacter temperatus TaxID=1458307 RepID=A0A0K0Y2N3_9RHOB|nr:GyrI-like domain-containing protein [Octadecabacter temperatus]AKS45167.1 Bacterial transcription activator, effector binding domain [Octadecabacter temperatus]